MEERKDSTGMRSVSDGDDEGNVDSSNGTPKVNGRHPTETDALKMVSTTTHLSLQDCRWEAPCDMLGSDTAPIGTFGANQILSPSEAQKASLLLYGS